MAGNTGIDGASLSGRVLDVLNCFDVAHPDLTLTEIARRAQLPLSTARRIAAVLEDRGFLERLVDKHYRVGIRVWEIGSLAPQQRGMREAALPFMHDLYEATQENVQLAVLEGADALCIEKISGASAVPTHTEVGGRLPLHATAVGKCLLAFSPGDLLRSVVDAGLTRYTPFTIIQPARLLTNVRETRRTGLSYSREEMSIGAISVAAPVMSAGGALRGSLSVVVRSSSRLEHLAPAVHAAALGIGRIIR